MKVFAFDTETTGLEKGKHEIFELAYSIQIGGVEKQSDVLLFRPADLKNVSEQALEVTGKTMNELRSFPSRKESFDILITVLDQYVDKYNKKDKFFFLGYNVGFDIDFLRFMFQWMAEDFPEDYGKTYLGSYFYHKSTDPRIDPFPVLQMYAVKYKLNLPNWRLETVCKHFGVELKNAHTALADLQATVELARKFYSAIKEIK